MEWQASKTSYELANSFLMRRLHLELEGGFPTNTGKNPVNLDETVSLTSKCVALPFELAVMHSRTQWTMMTDHQLNVMTQAPYPDDMAALLNRIYITWAYTNMKPGSRQVSVIIRNITSRPIHLPRGKVIACVVASNAVLNAEPSQDLLKNWRRMRQPSPIWAWRKDTSCSLLPSRRMEDWNDWRCGHPSWLPRRPDCYWNTRTSSLWNLMR